MLRESSDAVGKAVDLAAVMGQGANESGVMHGPVLLALAEAMFSGDAAAKSAVRRNLRRALGDAAFVDTCSVIASFNAVVKIADAIGIPLEDYKEKKTREIRQQLAIDAFLT